MSFANLLPQILAAAIPVVSNGTLLVASAHSQRLSSKNLRISGGAVKMNLLLAVLGNFDTRLRYTKFLPWGKFVDFDRILFCESVVHRKQEDGIIFRVKIKLDDMHSAYNFYDLVCVLPRSSSKHCLCF